MFLKHKNFLSPFDFINIFLVIWILFGVLYTLDQGVGLNKFLKFFIFGIMQIYLICILINREIRIKLVINIFYYLAIFIAIFTFFSFFLDVRTVNEHINTIYEEKELYKNSTIRNFRIVSLCPKLELGNEGKALGWSPKKKLAEYIEECRRNNWR